VVVIGDSADVTDVIINQSGNTLTAEINLGPAKLAAIELPASWDAAPLSFQAAKAAGGTYKNIFDSSGGEYTVPAGAGRTVIIPLTDFMAFQFIKVRSGTLGTPVAQSSPRTITLYTVP
jgi:hypothetical protein